MISLDKLALIGVAAATWLGPQIWYNDDFVLCDVNGTPPPPPLHPTGHSDPILPRPSASASGSAALDDGRPVPPHDGPPPGPEPFVIRGKALFSVAAGYSVVKHGKPDIGFELKEKVPFGDDYAQQIYYKEVSSMGNEHGAIVAIPMYTGSINNITIHQILYDSAAWAQINGTTKPTSWTDCHQPAPPPKPPRSSGAPTDPGFDDPSDLDPTPTGTGDDWPHPTPSASDSVYPGFKDHDLGVPTSSISSTRHSLLEDPTPTPTPSHGRLMARHENEHERSRPRTDPPKTT
ncbi:hypothetical protein PYCC9005_003451 [Savitreella phatthalungensis]